MPRVAKVIVSVILCGFTILLVVALRTERETGHVDENLDATERPPQALEWDESKPSACTRVIAFEEFELKLE